MIALHLSSLFSTVCRDLPTSPSWHVDFHGLLVPGFMLGGLRALARAPLCQHKEIVVSISKARGFLCMLAKLLGDVQAVKKGRVGKRVTRQAVQQAFQEASHGS